MPRRSISETQLFLPKNSLVNRRQFRYAIHIFAIRAEAAARLAELASFTLSTELPYLEFRALATEARQKLDQVRPSSLAQAARVPGVSPSDLQNLVLEALRWRRRVA